MSKLFTHIGQAVKYSFLHPEEAGTASCILTRVFETEDKEILTLIAGGVGDSMVVVFDPRSIKLKTLIKPRQYDRGTQFTPISITENLASHTLQCTKLTLPTGIILFRMTNGAWESLPHKRSKPLMDQTIQKQYLEYTLDEIILGEKLAAFISDYPDATATNYRDYLQGLIQQHIETHKAQLLQQKEQIQHQLQAFPGITNPTLGDFITWASQQNPQFRTQLESFLNALNIAETTLDNLPLSALEDQLQQVHLGDDITLHVEIMGTKTSQSLRLVL